MPPWCRLAATTRPSAFFLVSADRYGTAFFTMNLGRVDQKHQGIRGHQGQAGGVPRGAKICRDLSQSEQERGGGTADEPRLDGAWRCLLAMLVVCGNGSPLNQFGRAATRFLVQIILTSILDLGRRPSTPMSTRSLKITRQTTNNALSLGLPQRQLIFGLFQGGDQQLATECSRGVGA